MLASLTDSNSVSAVIWPTRGPILEPCSESLLCYLTARTYPLLDEFPPKLRDLSLQIVCLESKMWRQEVAGEEWREGGPPEHFTEQVLIAGAQPAGACWETEAVRQRRPTPGAGRRGNWSFRSCWSLAKDCLSSTNLSHKLRDTPSGHRQGHMCFQ